MLGEGGTLQGEEYGTITSKNGQGMTTWKGQGIGKFTGPGKVNFCGSIFFKVPSTGEEGKLSNLNVMEVCRMKNLTL
jgi:hypothetical protein